MSNEPMPSEPATGEPATGQTQPQASGRSIDAELVRAAVDRMEAAIGRERSTLERLRGELAALAQIIAEAKIAVHRRAVKPDAAAALDVTALLDELEHRVDAMLELGGHSRTQPMTRDEPSSIEPDRVPTVSGVVSRLGRGGDEPIEETAQLAAEAGERDGSSASMLEAMVLALSALDVVNQPTGQAPAAEAAERPAVMPSARAILPENELLTAVAQSEGFLNPPPAPAAVPAPLPEPPKPHDKPPAAARPDPLAPLKAMTDAEKIALFS
jgi:hypothetical protein